MRATFQVAAATVLAILVSFGSLGAQTNDCTADPASSYSDPLVCTGSCASDCIQREFESPVGSFHRACSCFSDSEPSCCHLIIKLTGSGGQPTGFGVKGSCPSCSSPGRCQLSDFTGVGGDAQANCDQVLPH